MKIREINVEDLMKECNFDNVAEFRSVLKGRNDLRYISLRGPISRDDANIIVRKLTGHDIDWYKYKVQERDLSDIGPLEQKSTVAERKLVEDWYRRLTANYEIEPSVLDCLLGLVCRGGFLEGESEHTEFLIKLDTSINIFIGDRGTGKSTILSLLGLMTESVSEETDTLVTQLLDALSPIPKTTSSKSQIANFSRRSRKLLQHYSIRQYAIFFTCNKEIFCYYVDMNKREFDVFEYKDRNWIVVEADKLIRPSILLLQQGEVLRIAEDRNQFYLNNTLDALYPDLHQKRTKFVQDVKQTVNQFEHFIPEYQRINRNRLKRFFEERERELENIWKEIDQSHFSETSMQTIQSYIDRYYQYVNYHFPNTTYDWWDQMPIAKLLSESDEGALYCLYVGRIVGFLGSKLKEIVELKKEPEPVSQDEWGVLGWAGLGQIGPNEQLDPLAEMSEDREILTELEQDLMRLSSEEQPSSEDSDQIDSEYEDRDLFLKAIAAMEMKPIVRVSDEVLQVALEIAEFLDTRLRILNGWIYIYGKRRVGWSKSLKALLNQYAELLRHKISLITRQENKCKIITDILNSNEIKIQILTRGTEKAIDRYWNEVKGLERAEEVYQELVEATPNTKLGKKIYYLAEAYDNAIIQAQRTLKALHKAVDVQQQFVFDAIDITLRQGNVYRDFTQLSFGQKSGIILEMVLTATDKHLIIIDQPEDNLDSNSIVNMLTPTLNHLAKKKQIIIATHNSNLAIGLNSKNLIALESHEGYGRIRVQGSPLKPRVTRQIMDVLEGGVATFEKRMNMFAEFINRLGGQIKDMDIITIERSFRRRTIDAFRNFLQPVISDKSLLDFVRHELKQEKPKRIHDDIQNVQQQIDAFEKTPELGADRLLEQLKNLSKNVDIHIARLQEAIDEVRLMDTEARPKTVDLFNFLVELRKNYLTKFSSTREIRITIDEKLQGYFVFVDEDHLRLIFHNLLNNSFRATELRAAEAFDAGYEDEISEIVQIELMKVSDNQVALKFKDNGCGMPPQIREKLYVERCSTQDGSDNGLGGIIISKLLDVNGGSIKVLESNHSGKSTFTEQEISIRRRPILL